MIGLPNLQPMNATSVILNLSAIFLTMFMPITGKRKKAKRPFIPLSDWGVNDHGKLVNLYRQQQSQQPIRFKQQTGK